MHCGCFKHAGTTPVLGMRLKKLPNHPDNKAERREKKPCVSLPLNSVLLHLRFACCRLCRVIDLREQTEILDPDLLKRFYLVFSMTSPHSISSYVSS